MRDVSNIIDRIKKCLAVGDSKRNPNEHEVANALAAAKRLMDEHSLSMADVVAVQEDVIKEGIEEHVMEERSGAPTWEYDLPWVCDELFGTRHYTKVGWPEYKRSVAFVGYASDVAMAVEVYKLLWLELMQMGRVWSYENPSPDLSRKQQLVRKFKYLEGVVLMLKRRAASSENYQGFSARQRNALVVMGKEKKQAVKDWLSMNRSLQTVHRRSTGLHDDAKLAGMVDANGISLNFSKAVKKGDSKPPLQLGHGKGD